MLNFWDTPAYQGIENIPASHATTCEAGHYHLPSGLSVPSLCSQPVSLSLHLCSACVRLPAPHAEKTVSRPLWDMYVSHQQFLKALEAPQLGNLLSFVQLSISQIYLTMQQALFFIFPVL